MTPVCSIRTGAILPRQDAAASANNPAATPILPGAPSIESLLAEAQFLVRNTRTHNALAKADVAQAERERALTEARDAMREAEEEQRKAEHKGKWVTALRTVGTIAGVVVGAASVCCSGGATAPAVVALIGVALSASSPYVAKATNSDKLGLALTLAGAAMSLGGGLAAAGTSAAGQWTTAEKVIILSSKATNASAEIGAGAATYSRGSSEASALEHRADAQQASSDAAREQVEVDEAISMLKEIEASARRAMNSIVAVADTRRSTTAAVIQNMRRA